MVSFPVFFGNIIWNINPILLVCLRQGLAGRKLIILLLSWVFSSLIVWKQLIIQGVSGLVGKIVFVLRWSIIILNLY